MSTAVVPMTQNDWTPDQMRLITDTVAKNASSDELKLFLYRCKIMKLDPLKPGQIHFVKYGTSPGTIVVGIEGFRSIAGRTGKISGVKRGVLKDEKGKLVGGWAEVYRTDWKEPAREEVPFAEYNTGKGPWAKMPETMIKKVAEAAALRMAFPDDLGGIYTQEEMHQAEATEKPVIGTQRVVAEQPMEGDGNPDYVPGYRIDFGQWKNRSLEEVYRNVGAEKIANYILFLEESAEKKGKPLSEPIQKFIQEAETYLAAMENDPMEDVT